MRIAWPELIVLIVFATLFVLGAEGFVFFVITELRLPGLVIIPIILAMLAADLWGLLRLIDWAFAGPARRAKQRIL